MPSKTKGPVWTPELGKQPVPYAPSYGEPLLIPSAQRVTLVFEGQAFGESGSRQDVDWPTSWRMPQQGEVIRVSTERAGKVSSIDWDLGTRIPVIYLR